MKMLLAITRVLLGLTFVVFGSNHVLHFIPMGPMPAGPAAQFAGALFTTGYIYFVTVFEVAGGILLLINRYVPLALALLAPVIVNIDLFHSLMAPSGLPIAALISIFWLLTAWRARSVFLPLLRQRVTE